MTAELYCQSKANQQVFQTLKVLSLSTKEMHRIEVLAGATNSVKKDPLMGHINHFWPVFVNKKNNRKYFNEVKTSLKWNMTYKVMSNILENGHLS